MAVQAYRVAREVQMQLVQPRQGWSRSLRLGLVAFGVVALAACGGGAGTSSPGVVQSTQPAASKAAAGSAGYTVEVKQDAALGPYLVGEDGKSLYLLTKDTSGASTCVDQCAANWPPFTLDDGETVAAGAGVTGQIATIKRPDGSQQVAINGVPLYYFKGDAGAGQTNGQGVNGVWFLVTPAGTPVGSGASPSMGGGYTY